MVLLVAFCFALSVVFVANCKILVFHSFNSLKHVLPI